MSLNRHGTVKYRHRLLTLAALTVGGIAVSACQPAPGSPEASIAVNHVAGLVNQTRTQQGRGALRIDDALDNTAQVWANQLAAAGSLSHSPNLGAGRSWSTAGENVGVGDSIDNVENAFLRSPAHAANIVDSRFSVIGVGVAVGDDGRVWVVQQFMRPR